MRRGVCDFVQKPWDNAQLARDAAHGNREGTRAAPAQRQLERARARRGAAHPAQAAARDAPADRRLRARRLVAAGVPASAAIASTRSRSAPTRLGAVDRRRRRQGHPGGAADVEPAGRRPRVRDRAAEPAELCQQVNRILCGNIAEGRFISFFYCIARHRPAASLTYANAGHYPPMLVRADGSVERLGDRRARARRLAEPRTSRRHVALGSGDRLVLFTDGITEVRCAAQTTRPETRIRRGASRRRCRRASRVQRAGAPGAAGRAVSRVHRRHVPGRCDADGAGGR